jgi:hypothetical protein
MIFICIEDDVMYSCLEVLISLEGSVGSESWSGSEA